MRFIVRAPMHEFTFGTAPVTLTAFWPLFVFRRCCRITAGNPLKQYEFIKILAGIVEKYLFEVYDKKVTRDF
jgi:hypothetical protein